MKTITYRLSKQLTRNRVRKLRERKKRARMKSLQKLSKMTAGSTS
jgi:hypothetical protein